MTSTQNTSKSTKRRLGNPVLIRTWRTQEEMRQELSETLGRGRIHANHVAGWRQQGAPIPAGRGRIAKAPLKEWLAKHLGNKGISAHAVSPGKLQRLRERVRLARVKLARRRSLYVQRTACIVEHVYAMGAIEEHCAALPALAVDKTKSLSAQDSRDEIKHAVTQSLTDLGAMGRARPDLSGIDSDDDASHTDCATMGKDELQDVIASQQAGVLRLDFMEFQREVIKRSVYESAAQCAFIAFRDALLNDFPARAVELVRSGNGEAEVSGVMRDHIETLRLALEATLQ